jgi:murein DD-endopeptidase MepM/ murein hydrolase activator NlpD
MKFNLKSRILTAHPTVLLTLLLLLSVSCSASPAPEPTAPLSIVAGPASPIPSTTPTETFTPTPIQTPTPIPTPTDHSPLITEICSPLAVQPLDKIREIITQPFRMPRILDNGTYSDDAHHGVDLGYYTRDGELFTGTPVLSALDGTIAAIIHDRPPYGNMIMVETPFEQIPPQLIQSLNIPAGNSLYVLYAHLQNLQTFNLQQLVTCGQQLAETGLTGFTGGPHLHFEMRWGPTGTTFPDGMAFYRADTTEAERTNYQTWRMSGTFHLFNPMDLLTVQP